MELISLTVIDVVLSVPAITILCLFSIPNLCKPQFIPIN